MYLSSHCGIRNSLEILTQLWLFNNDLIFKFLPHVFPTLLRALTVQICYKKLKPILLSNYWVAVPYVNLTLFLIQLRKNILNSCLRMLLSIRSVSFLLMNFPLILSSVPDDIAIAYKWPGLTRMSCAALNGASHQTTENIWWWASCLAAATLHALLTRSPNTHFFLCSVSRPLPSILFKSAFLLFKNSQIKDRCVRIGSGTSELR